MEQHPINGRLPSRDENIILEGNFKGNYRTFAVFIICCGLLLAAFAVSAVWMQKGDPEWLSGLGNFGNKEERSAAEDGTGEETESLSDTSDPESTTEPNPEEAIPEGATPVIPMDLSCPSLGKEYIHNETPYTPDVSALLEKKFSCPSDSEKPLVLILHTHTSEAYLPADTKYVEGILGDVTYSREERRNILSVGKVLCDTLNEKGITAIHCTVMHDDPTLSGSYSRSEETVKKYLEMYPSIEYVIDLHRDAVTTSDGEFVRAVTEYEGEDTAQVMAVIGTDCNGTQHDGWEDNLALALQLREALNADGAALCRPVSLRNASYNQELAKHALLLEIGTGANSVEEAERAAVLVGEALAKVIQPR